MIETTYLCVSIVIMAAVTYMIRMLPLAAVRGKIKSRFVLDFLYYIPYAVLSAMTIPAIFFSSGSLISAAVGLLIALVLAFFERGLMTVAVCSCAGVFVTELVMTIFWGKPF
ncbi:MAG: AzlD domain-containing protein [Oscillospiraceae bacterium]|nr:AzlD domain-containing protein [Oscillospiraceae bacterium]